jgi:hypothetical protein
MHLEVHKLVIEQRIFKQKHLGLIYSFYFQWVIDNVAKTDIFSFNFFKSFLVELIYLLPSLLSYWFIWQKCFELIDFLKLSLIRDDLNACLLLLALNWVNNAEIVTEDVLIFWPVWFKVIKDVLSESLI